MSIYDKIVETAITFDDVLLVPSYSEVLPNQVSLKSRLSDKITLNVPIVSAAMDTVTEADMAIALARVGGLGFIHKNMPIEEQASQVNQVKRSENGMIANPVTLSKDHTLAEAKALMAQFKISGLPVVDEEHKLIGIITNRDVKYQENLSVKVEELMTKENLIVSNEEVNLEKAKEILLKNRVEKLPIVDKSNKLIGLITIKDIDNQLEYPNANKDKSGRLIVGAGVGIGVDTIERVSALVEAGVDIIAVDSAHGHSKGVLDKIKEINDSLYSIDYSRGRYIKLIQKRTQDKEIIDFRASLNNITENSMDENNLAEEKFFEIKKIIDRFKGRVNETERDKKWTSHVTDVRNWFHFSATEYWRDTDEEYEHYTDSGGKSGGQKEKLAYTILGASLAYNYGINEKEKSSFRLIIIDEAFLKSSDESATFGLELFKKLDFQFIIVTPLLKINTMEPYVRHVGFVTYNDTTHKSRIHNLTLGEYIKMKEKYNGEL